ncbi:MAG TPA: DUF4446 family protein [Patescibacteria group bacterium]
MAWLFNFLVIINLLATVYLTAILYKKNSNKNAAGGQHNSDNGLNQEDITSVVKSIQKVSLTRFNPFDDIGGDQSFVLCLLDKNNNGVILTSLHNKDNTRVYCKAVKNAEGDACLLSKEEKSAIVKTIKN